MELIKDVANELDIDVLCHKILVNVGLLTHADRGSLFLVKGNSAQNRCLVAKLFDVTQSTGKGRKRWLNLRVVDTDGDEDESVLHLKARKCEKGDDCGDD